VIALRRRLIFSPRTIRAEKRADDENFNTLTSGEASINAAIITALKSPSDTSRIKIRELYQALYAQNVLKYAYEIDAALASDVSALGRPGRRGSRVLAHPQALDHHRRGRG
jgi:hypothetical protein